MRSAALSQEGGMKVSIASSTPLPPVSAGADTAPQSVGPGPPAPFDAGMVDAEVQAPGHQQRAGQQQQRA